MGIFEFSRMKACGRASVFLQCRIINTLRLEGTSGDHPDQPPCQGSVTPEQVTEERVWVGLEGLKRETP